MIEIQPNILEKLKCSECQEYLSCTPVFVKQNGDSICGRCPPKSESFRNKAFEEVASLIMFPCRFKKDGCPKKLTLTEVAKHEENCVHQKMLCPSCPTGICNWFGFSADLLQHFREKHVDLVVDHPYIFKHDTTKTTEKNLLATVFGFLFLIQIKCSLAANVIYNSVSLVGPSKVASQFKYYLKVSKNNQRSLDDNATVEQISKTIGTTKNSIAFDIKALEAIFTGFQDVCFSLLISRQEFNCILCSKTITETTTNITKECATFCDNCNPATPITEKGLNNCISYLDGCTYKGNDNNMQKHIQWFCKFGINKCQFCNQMFKSHTRIDHLMKKCDSISLQYSCLAFNELNINEQPILMNVSVFGKEFYCVFINKRKTLAINVVTDNPKEDMTNFSIEIAIDSDRLNTKNKNQRLIMSDEAKSDWKGTFNIANVSTDIKFYIKKCK